MEIWKRFYLFVVLAMCFPMTTYGAELKTVRVAFLPELHGFFEMEENGSYSGYNHDYLMTVVQHTNWNIEYIIIEEGTLSDSVNKAYELLESGALDLFGPFFENNPQLERFATGEKSYSICRYNFYSARNNYALTQNNYFYQEQIKVALANSTPKLNQALFAHMEELDIPLDITAVNERNDSLNLLLQGEVDAIVYADMSISTAYLDYLSTLDYERIYFASTKGNTQVLKDLDEAIGKIEVIQPDIHQKLSDTYFGTRYTGEFLFTEAELSFLSQQNTFTVGLLENSPPYQYQDETGAARGITIEIMEKLENLLGISFELHWFQNPEELYYAMIHEEIDIFATLPHDYNLINHLNVVLTTPYLSSRVYWLRNEQEIANPSYLYHYVSNNIPFFHNDDLTMVVNIEECLQIMDDTGEFSIFCDPYIAEYYLAHLRLNHITTQSVTDVLSEITFGIRQTMDENLVGMLNRGILFLDNYALDEIIYRNTTVPQEYTLTEFFRDYGIPMTLTMFCIFILVITVILRYTYKFRDLSRRDGMTKLYNSGYFHQYAEKKTPHLSAGALILVDIDYFKEVNDTHGHLAGDSIIKIVAEHMKIFAEGKGIFARLGGDEFVILLEGKISQERLEMQAREILNALQTNSANIPTTLSIGGYLFQEGTAYQTLYKQADEILYQVKERGRNSYAFCNHVTMHEAKGLETHCLNYDIFQDKVSHILSSSDEDTHHAMITIQIEGLQDIIKEQGEEFSADYLSVIGKRLKRQVKEYDILGCQGENIFVMLVEFSGNHDTLNQRMASMKKSLENEVASSKMQFAAETTISVALYPEQGKTYSELFENSDVAFTKKNQWKEN